MLANDLADITCLKNILYNTIASIYISNRLSSACAKMINLRGLLGGPCFMDPNRKLFR